MIELGAQRCEGGRDVGKVHNPPCYGIDTTCHMHLNPIRVPVELGALVSIYDIGETVGSLEREFLENLHYLIPVYL
jgi:hypothetical protein